MPDSIDDLIPNAKQIQREAALKEAEKADEYARLPLPSKRRRTCADRAAQPSVRQIRGGKGQARPTVIQRAVRNGLTEVQVYGSRTRCAPTRAAPSISRSRAGRIR